MSIEHTHVIPETSITVVQCTGGLSVTGVLYCLYLSSVLHYRYLPAVPSWPPYLLYLEHGVQVLVLGGLYQVVVQELYSSEM